MDITDAEDEDLEIGGEDVCADGDGGPVGATRAVAGTRCTRSIRALPLSPLGCDGCDAEDACCRTVPDPTARYL
jgi:hypothetical protein